MKNGKKTDQADNNDQIDEEIRHYEQLSTCPCTNCDAICVDLDQIADCEPFNEWYEKYHRIRRR